MQAEPEEIHVYRKRWLVLTLVVCLIFMLIFSYVNFGIVNNIIVAYFNTSYAAVDWTVLGNNLGTILTTPVIAFLALKKIISCKKSLVIASSMQVMNFVFLIIGLLQRKLFVFVVLGQVLGGVSAAVLWSVPAVIAPIWFAESQIGLAIGIAMIGSSTGSITGYILPTHLVKSPQNGTKFLSKNLANYTSIKWFLDDKFVYQWLFSTLLLTSVIILLLLVFVVPEMPEKPPSMTQYLKRQKSYDEQNKNVSFGFFICSVKFLLFDKIFVAYATASSTTLHIFVLWELCIEEIAHRNYFIEIKPEKLSAYIMMLVPVGCFIGNITGGLLLDKFKKYRLQSIVGILFAFFASVAILLSILFKVLIAIFVSFFFFGLSVRTSYISILDSIMQHTYPMEPVFVVSILTFLENTIVLCVAEIDRHIIYNAGLIPGIIIICALLFFVTLLCIVFKPIPKRLSAEKSREKPSSENTSLLSP